MSRTLLHFLAPDGAAVPLVLASRSETRASQLRAAGFAFSVQHSGIDETDREEEDVRLRVEALSVAKARAVAEPGGRRLVVGCDTLVLHGDVAVGQPRDAADAGSMLRLLSNGIHDVVTGLCVVNAADGRLLSSTHSTTVRWRSVDDDFLDAYVASGRWRGKAGAYDLLGLGSVLVQGVVGDPAVVLGLPMGPMIEHCRALGMTVSLSEQDSDGV